MHLTSHQVLTRLLMLGPAWTLEEMWEQGQRTWAAKDTLRVTPDGSSAGQGEPSGLINEVAALRRQPSRLHFALDK